MDTSVPKFSRDTKIALFDRCFTFVSLLVQCCLPITALSYLTHFVDFFSGGKDFRTAGFMDSVQYWSAFDIWRARGNPYDPSEMFARQSPLNIHSASPLTEPIMMWNPPSLTALFSPVLQISDYFLFARLWMLLSLTCFLAGTMILVRTYSPRLIKDRRLWILLLTFIPFLNCLYFGQISGFLFLGSALLMSGIKRKSLWQQVVGVILLSFKPHLLLPFWLAVLCMYIHSRSWKIIITLVLGVSLVLFLGIHGVDFWILTDWYGKVSGDIPLVGATSTMSWIGATLSTPMRQLTDMFWPKGALAVASMAPVIGLCMVPWVIKKFDRITGLALLLVISLPTARYGWVYDYSLLITPMIIVLSQTKNLSRTFDLLLVASFIAFLPIHTVFRQQHEALYSLLPFVLVLGWLLIHSRANAEYGSLAQPPVGIS